MAKHYSLGLIDEAIRPSVPFSATERSSNAKNHAEDQRKETRYRKHMIFVCMSVFASKYMRVYCVYVSMYNCIYKNSKYVLILNIPFIVVYIIE